MPLATQDDVRAALRRELTESEQEWVDGLISESADLVAGYLYPYLIPDSTPAEITRVVAAMTAAVFNRPANLLPDTQSLTADSYGVTFTPDATSPGPKLTAALKERLRPFKRGVMAVGMASERGAAEVDSD